MLLGRGAVLEELIVTEGRGLKQAKEQLQETQGLIRDSCEELKKSFAELKADISE